MAVQPFLPYARPCTDQSEIDALAPVMNSGMLTGGQQIAAFEAAFSEHCEGAGAIAVSSGTTALHLALWSLGIGPDMTVVVPSMTFLADAAAARYVGADVVFADVDPDSGLMTPETLEEACSRAEQSGLPPVRAAIIVHFAGNTGDLAGLQEIARARNLFLIEDACHALGSRYQIDDAWHNVGCGRHSDLTVFSFHPTKTITTGEGGMITTRDQDRKGALAMLRNHGMQRHDFASPELALDATGQPNPWYYELQSLGHNFRLGELNSALGVVQMRKLPEFAARRREMARYYQQKLAATLSGSSADLTSRLQLLQPLPAGDPVFHLMIAFVDFEACGMERAAFMAGLRDLGIGTQVHYLPLHLQPYYRQRYGDVSLPGAERFYSRCLSLPFFPDLSDSDIDRVVEGLYTLVKGTGQ